MTAKTDIEMARFALAKATKNEIRFRHQLNADIEINDVLPRRLADFDKTVQQGTLPSMYLQIVASTEDDDATN